MQLFNTRTGTQAAVAQVPFYPFRGALSLVLSPDRMRIAVLTPIEAIQPTQDGAAPHHDEDWHVEKRPGFVHLGAGQKVRWARLPDQARYPVELFNWSPDSATVALRARARAGDKEASLFVAAAENLRVEAWGAGGVACSV